MLNLLLVGVLGLALPSVSACSVALRPVDGPVIAEFSPQGRYAGHWGADFAAPAGSPVRAVMSGWVTFAGLVVENRAVTIAHGGGLRTSYSYLGALGVTLGDRVRAGEMVGLSGPSHGTASVHVSARLGDRYLDPVRLLACRWVPGDAVALRSVSGLGPYPRRRARHPGRNVRPSPRRSPRCGGDRVPPAGPGSGDLHPRRRPMAEGGSTRFRARASLGDDRARHRRHRVLRRRRP